MLVVSRKIGEELKVGDNIIVKIIDIDKNQVKIGIEAPKNVTILRAELIEQITKENKKAAKKVDIDTLKNISDIFKG